MRFNVSGDDLQTHVLFCISVTSHPLNRPQEGLDLADEFEVRSEGVHGVTAVFALRDGRKRRASIRAGNRVPYLARHFELTEQLDLTGVTRIEFE
jgi:hypothetical protein